MLQDIRSYLREMNVSEQLASGMHRRQFSRSGALEHACGVYPDLAKGIIETRAHSPASGWILMMDLFMTIALIMAFVAGWLLCDSVLPWFYKR